MTGTFTATLTGGSTTDYYCEAAVDFEGPIDWYLIEESTSTYTYIATTASESIFFFINNPTAGYYRVWGQSASMGIDTNPVYLGVDPYPGVTLVNGVFEFPSEQAYEDMIDKLEDQYEAHSAAFYDQYANLTEDDIAALEISQSFDDLKPYKDFESYFGFSSLREKIEGEVNAWAAIGEGEYPESNYLTADESEQTLLNVNGEVKIAGVIVNKGGEGFHTSNVTCQREYSASAEVYPDPNDSNLEIYEKIWGNGDPSQRSKVLMKARKTNGKKRIAVRMNVRSYGYIYRQDCTGDKPFDSGWKGEKTRKRYCKRFSTGGIMLYFGSLHFRPNFVTGQFSARGYTTTLVFQ